MAVKKNRKKGSSKGSFSKNIFTVFLEHPYETLNYKQVAGRMGINDKAGRELVLQFIDGLVAEHALTEVRRGKYRLNHDFLKESEEFRSVVSGRIDVKASGKAYVSTPELSDDILIAPHHTNKALHGDTVKVLVFPRRKNQRPEGQVLEVLKRAREEFAGILQTGKYYGIFTCDSVNMPLDIMIPNDKTGKAKNGDKVIVKITEWPEKSANPVGEVVHVLGKPGVNEVEMQSILVEFGFPLAFPSSVEHEAGQIARFFNDAEIHKRRDFRKVFTMTIDPADAKDFDDALSLKKLDNGHYEVGVHIADVSHYVRPGSRLDEEAASRGTSVYLVDRTIPMLPETLSNQLCSLSPHEDKLCFSAVFEMDDLGNIQQEWYGKTVINSDRRFNYEEAQEIIESGTGDFASEVLTLHKLAVKLREERFRKGSIAFETEEVKFRLDENGKPLGVYLKEYKDSNKLIEDFMLLANRKVAEYIQKFRTQKSAPVFVYRVHDTPNPEKLAQFSEFIAKLGYNIKTASRKGMSQSFNELFSKIKGKGEENLISGLAIRTMAKAFYSTDNIGHYGLGFRHYTHFTSPIRRYPDLLVHRLLDAYLHNQTRHDRDAFEHQCFHSSEMERKATEAERASIKYKQAEFLLDKIGQEFTGLVSGISRWGIYVELKESKCEGMVPVRDMTDDYYFIDEENYVAIGQSRGKQYRLGDTVNVKIKSIDLARKTIDFSFCKPAK